jgi:hypothetical protein
MIPTTLAAAVIWSTAATYGKKPGDEGSNSENGANQECQKPTTSDDPEIYRERRNDKHECRSECCNADSNSSDARHEECGTGDSKAVSYKHAEK